jgi:hypothetical protein
MSKYYQESKIVYGLNPFLDMGDVIDIAQKAALKYLRSLLGLKNNVSSLRSRLVFGLSKLEHNLITRLVKNVRKYQEHFLEFPEIYRKTLEEYRKWAGLEQHILDIPLKELKQTFLDKSIQETARKENITIGPRFREIIDKFLYKWPDRRENMLVRYILKYGFFDPRLFEQCKLCGEANSRTHVTNECRFFSKQRSNTLTQIGKITGIGNTTDLESWIMRIYFAPYSNWSKVQIRNLIETIKSFIATLYMDRKKEPEEEKMIGRQTLRKDKPEIG